MNDRTTRLPVFFFSHGGGPWPYVENMRRQFAVSEAAFRALPATLPARPKAVLAISGHWEAPVFTVSTAAQPPTLYDYAGFPEHTYRITYPAPGAPALAQRVCALLSAAGIDSAEDAGRGFDHGTFVPLGLMYPQADVPIVTLSMQSGYDPAAHLRLGEALAPLRDEGVLIVGSGLSYHNMRGFGQPASAPVAERFEEWLNDTISLPDPAARAARLIDWEQAPGARLAHPREDHLIPLMVVAGAAGSDVGRREFIDRVWHVVMASYRFGA